MDINSFDIDGVIFINNEITGVYPGPNDVIITGRSIEEAPETYKMLKARGINNLVYFNALPFESKTRESSGVHKGKIIQILKMAGINVKCHFEDDEIQIQQIKAIVPDVKIVHLVHDMTEKENVRHDF